MNRIIAKRPDIDNPTVPNGIRGYGSDAARSRAIAMLAKQGCNYFVTFCDVRSRFALSFGYAKWVSSGSICVQ